MQKGDGGARLLESVRMHPRWIEEVQAKQYLVIKPLGSPSLLGGFRSPLREGRPHRSPQESRQWISGPHGLGPRLRRLGGAGRAAPNGNTEGTWGSAGRSLVGF